MMNLLFKNNKSTISINGRNYTGSSIKIDNGVVIVDGKEQEGSALVGPVNVQVNGDIEQLSTVSGDIVVNGDAGFVKTTSGDIRCETVKEGVTTVSGDVTCNTILGSVSTLSGDIRGA